ncbi:MAG: FAD:protein FMN transferase [Saprospiraceae bacterium]|nr:FAD:protein FMN transferase [Lewinella sp.]
MSIGQLLPAQTLQRFQFFEPKMGTEFRIVLYATDKEQADKAATAAFRRIDELNLIFSDYQEDSEVSKLSDTAGSGEKVAVSVELWEVLHFARQLSKKSRGAFDVSIGPLSKLWRRAFRRQEFPEWSQIEADRALVSFKKIKLYTRGHQVKLKKEGMRLDLGGIAKGYTVDAVYRVLTQHGIDIALVDGGGDIYAGAPPPGEKGWEIRFVPAATPEQEETIQLTRGAIASSGSTYKYLEWEGRKYSHIIDPRTGLGVTETAIINVIADNCVKADALASTLSVLNETERGKLLAAYPKAVLK